jgi:hypothetical protein
MSTDFLKKVLFFSSVLIFLFPLSLETVSAADTNTTVSSTVVTDKTPPTASAPSINVNNSDICKSGNSAALQTQIFGIASGITITDKNCERIKLARSLYFMGMKVAAVSLLCQDARVFDAMIMAGTPCPYDGRIGRDAKKSWEKDFDNIPGGSVFSGKIKEKRRVALEKEYSSQFPIIVEDDPELQHQE